VASGFCTFCGSQRAKVVVPVRKTAAQRGYDGKWQKYRAAYLKSHAYCVDPRHGEVLVLATVVDHIIPHRGDKRLFWLHSNHQPLCKRCHDIKTATEDGGFGR
jgi:5-methylcytosine-specific restriction protein A